MRQAALHRCTCDACMPGRAGACVQMIPLPRGEAHSLLCMNSCHNSQQRSAPGFQAPAGHARPPAACVRHCRASDGMPDRLMPHARQSRSTLVTTGAFSNSVNSSCVPTDAHTVLWRLYTSVHMPLPPSPAPALQGFSPCLIVRCGQQCGMQLVIMYCAEVRAHAGMHSCAPAAERSAQRWQAARRSQGWQWEWHSK